MESESDVLHHGSACETPSTELPWRGGKVCGVEPVNILLDNKHH